MGGETCMTHDSGEGTGIPIYHWTSLEKALTALNSDRLQARRWQHWIEAEGKMISGTSWSLNPWKWAAEYPVCLVADRDRIANCIHSINGSRTFWQTKGMIDSLYDSNAYLLEPSDPDEEFVEGTIRELSSALIGVLFRGLHQDDVDRLACVSSLVSVETLGENVVPVAYVSGRSP